MATSKRSTHRRAKSRAASRAKATTKSKSTSTKQRATRAVAKSARATAPSKPKAVARPKSTPAPSRTAKPKAVSAAKTSRAAAVENVEATALKAKFQRERNGLEKRLTEAVREIGILRLHELRAMQLERQVADRDATIERLQAQLADLERRPSEPVYVREVQQSLALSAPAHDLRSSHERFDDGRADVEQSRADLDDAAADLDEFEDDRLDADLVSDDD